jgi:arylsulfatase A
MPTLLELTGGRVEAPSDIDGISLAPTLLGKEQPARPFLYREFPSYGGQQTIRVGDWKAVRQNMAKGNLKIELYNIANDISEQNDVANEHPEVVEQLAALMKREHVPSDVFPLHPLDTPAIKSAVRKK